MKPLFLGRPRPSKQLWSVSKSQALPGGTSSLAISQMDRVFKGSLKHNKFLITLHNYFNKEKTK